MSSSWRESSGSQAVKSPPREARCSGCGNWIATTPSGSEWVRARCGNNRFNGENGRKCPMYGKSQTIHFR